MKRRLSVIAAATVVALLASALPAAARVPHQTPRRKLEGAVSNSLSSKAAAGSVAGILITRGAATVFEMNGDRPLTPASLTKLATTLVALIKFGPEHRFATRVAGRAPRGGVVDGDLTLIGGGDPTLSTAAYAAKRYLPAPDDPLPVPVYDTAVPTIETLASAIAAKGIRRVTGSLIVDESIFDEKRTQQGWLPSYQKRNSVEVGNLSGLAIDEGFADVDGNLVEADPAMRAGRLLAAALARRGVSIGRGVARGTAGAKPNVLARVASPPLDEIVRYTNRYSVNFAAEMLLKNLGAAFGPAGTAAAGVAVIRETLAGKRIPVSDMVLTDGSGLSVLNRLTPRTISGILRYALADETPAGASMRDSLPVAGGPGTLFKRLRQAPAVGNLRGKTGLIRSVRGMAGWVEGRDGSTLTYVTIFNDAASASRLTTPIDVIALALARFPYG